MLRNILPAILFIAALAACKKDEDSGSGGTLEVMGNLAPEYTIGFAVSGEPLIHNGGSVYRWSNANGAWKLVGGSQTGRVTGVYNDARGDYFAHNGRQLLRSINGTEPWDTVAVVSGRTNLGNAVVMNSRGDLVARVSIKADTLAYYRKGASDADWVFVTAVPALYGNEARHYPAYLSDDGILYYNFDSQAGYLTDLTMNTKTGQYGLLYNKGLSGSTGIGGNGILPGYVYVAPDGDVYGVSATFRMYRIEGSPLPGRISPQPDYTNPKLHESEWETSMGPVAVDAAGRLRCLLICSKYPETHYSPATASTSGGSFTVVRHGGGQQRLCTNFKGEVFVWEYNGMLYRWK